MLLNRSIFKYTVIFGLSAWTLSAYSQEQSTPDTTKTPPTIEEVEVVRDYRPILADAVKIRRSPDMSNIRRYQPRLKYNVLDKRLNLPSGMHQLRIEEMPSARPESMLPNYVKVGVGNYNSYLGELYINTPEDAYIQAGGYIKHLSQKGELNGQKFSEQAIGVFGKSILDYITLTGNLGYNRYSTAFYGLVEGAEALNENPENQAYNDIFFSGELYNNYDPEDHDISYSLKADAYLFSDKFNAKENAFALTGYFNKAINAFNIGANVSADFTGLKSADYTQSNHIARFNPYIRFQGNNYKLTLGVNFIAEFGDSSRTNLIPKADIELDIVPEYATLFAGITGDVIKTSLRSLAQENPYLNENINIQNTVEKLHFFGGVKGNAGATFGYKAQVFYRELENIPFFVNNKLYPHKFDIVYDAGESGKNTIMGLEGEINVRISETVALGGKLNLYEYKLSTEEEPWFMPTIRITSNARINISERVLIDGALVFNGGTSAKTYDFAASNVITDPIIVSVPAFLDISAGAEYRINKQFGISVRANNLLGQTYERYLYYPRLGLNVFGGVNFSF